MGSSIGAVGSSLHLPLHLTRGIAIFLVVLGHALGPVQEQSIIGPAIVSLVRVIFSFHMPLFFFISGFVGTRIFLCTRQERPQIVVRQLKRLMAVYFFYTVVAVAVKLVAANYVNRPIEWHTLLSATLLYPYTNPLLDLWFLYALFMIQMLFIVFRMVVGIDYRRPTHAAMLVVVLLAANACSRALSMQTILGAYAVTQYALYFFAGFLVSCYDDVVQSCFRRYKVLTLLSGSIYLLFILICSTTLHISWLSRLLGAVMGIMFTWALGIYLADTSRRLSVVIGQLSHYSYGIYLHEGFWQEATKIVIVKLLSWPTLFVLPVGVLGGIVVPICLSKFVLQKVVFLRRFALGDWRT